MDLAVGGSHPSRRTKRPAQGFIKQEKLVRADLAVAVLECDQVSVRGRGAVKASAVSLSTLSIDAVAADR